MFDQDADEAFVAAEDRAVQHDRAVALAVLGDIARVEALGQDAVRPDRADLPRPPDRVGQMPFELWRISRALARTLLPAITLGRGHRADHHIADLRPQHTPHHFT